MRRRRRRNAVALGRDRRRRYGIVGTTIATGRCSADRCRLTTIRRTCRLVRRNGLMRCGSTRCCCLRRIVRLP